jgi:orotidine-5'-phosphate decarboxylase
MPEHFADRLASRINDIGAPACVGLDPVLEQLPAEVRSACADPASACRRFCTGVLDAIAGTVPAVKPQAACFERYGPAGVDALHAVCARARQLGFVVVLDAKRGDIGISNRHYAASAFDGLDADALTVSPYLGVTGLSEFRREGRGLFVLVRTSNAEGDELQSLPLASGKTVSEHVAHLVSAWGRQHSGVGSAGLSDVGAVVGATKAAEGQRLRTAMPDQVFLIPGYGAQGGTLDDVRQLLRPGAQTLGAQGVLVNAGRSVLYPAGPESVGLPWAQRIADAAKRFARELSTLR